MLQASSAAFLIVKYIGAVYLVYLGMRAIRERNGVALDSLSLASDWKVFRQGVLTNLFNPKAVLFYVSFLPQFVNPIRGHAQLQLVFLGFSFAALDLVCLMALAYSAGHANAWLTRKAQNARLVRLATGTLLVGLGVRLAFTEKNHWHAQGVTLTGVPLVGERTAKSSATNSILRSGDLPGCTPPPQLR